MIAYSGYADLFSAFSRLAANATGFDGVLYRACSPEYANTRDLLAGEGARRNGGRWNAPGSFPMVYLAQSVEGAIAETLGVAGQYGFDPAARLPMTLVAIDATLDRVLDLTDVRVRRTIGTTLTAMTRCAWRDENAADREALTQAIGRAAHQAGPQGILVPSAVKRSLRNISIFPINLEGAARLKIRRADKLPPPPASGMP